MTAIRIAVAFDRHGWAGMTSDMMHARACAGLRYDQEEGEFHLVRTGPTWWWLEDQLICRQTLFQPLQTITEVSSLQFDRQSKHVYSMFGARFPNLVWLSIPYAESGLCNQSSNFDTLKYMQGISYSLQIEQSDCRYRKRRTVPFHSN